MAIYDKNKIFLNSLMLYVRMLIILAVSLFTVRILLNVLGIIDYGIYNIVGSIVSLFSFLSYSLSIATQRYFSTAIGKQNLQNLQNLFNLFLLIYIVLAIFLLISLEVFGLWFLNNQLNVPADRLIAAKFVFHFSVLSFIVGIIYIPFQALIIAFEYMRVFAYISIIEALLKLLIVGLVIWSPFDKLITYAMFVFFTSLLITTIYIIYCLRKFSFCKFQKYWNKEVFNEIISFSGWNLFGSIAGVLNVHGVNVVLNLFFGPLINAARGIAVQANTIVNQFIANFITAVNPQITKLYAVGDIFNMQNLVYKSSKYSFLLMLIIFTPFWIEAHFFLDLWLSKIPEYSLVFFKLILINTLIDSLSYPFQTAVQATGKIKYYQIVVGSLLLINVPLAYGFYWRGYPVETCFYVSICIAFIALFIRLFMLKKIINFSILLYVKKYLLRVVLVLVLISIFYLFRKQYLNFVSIPLLILLELFVISIFVFFIGINAQERKFFCQKFSIIKNKGVELLIKKCN